MLTMLHHVGLILTRQLSECLDFSIRVTSFRLCKQISSEQARGKDTAMMRSVTQVRSSSYPSSILQAGSCCLNTHTHKLLKCFRRRLIFRCTHSMLVMSLLSIFDGQSPWNQSLCLTTPFPNPVHCRLLEHDPNPNKGYVKETRSVSTVYHPTVHMEVTQYCHVIFCSRLLYVIKQSTVRKT